MARQYLETLSGGVSSGCKFMSSNCSTAMVSLMSPQRETIVAHMNRLNKSSDRTKGRTWAISDCRHPGAMHRAGRWCVVAAYHRAGRVIMLQPERPSHVGVAGWWWRTWCSSRHSLLSPVELNAWRLRRSEGSASSSGYGCHAWIECLGQKNAVERCNPGIALRSSRYLDCFCKASTPQRGRRISDLGLARP